MIDYFSHVAALHVCLTAIKNAPPPDPNDKKAVIEAVLDSGSEPGAAMLGALVDHWLQYSQPQTCVEIEILSQAAPLFQTGVEILSNVDTARSGLEQGLTTPTSPAALAAYNSAIASLPGIATDIQNLATKLAAFQASFSGPWMVPVGQQANEAVPEWTWRDVFLARRTTAFVAAAQKLATTARQRAFAFGTLAGAAGNVLGSSYLNSVVGGPRRSHQLRHRLAAYSVGAWLRDNEPTLATTLQEIQTALTFGQAGPSYTLPPGIKAVAQAALRNAYPTGTAALPDLDTGYNNLLKHLALLQEFVLPPVPPAPNGTLLANMVALNVFTLGVDNQIPGGSGVGTNYPEIGPHEKAGAVCETLLAWLFYPPSFITAVINYLYDATGGGQGAQVGTTEDGLVAASQSPTALSAINSLYAMSLSCWQALAAGRTALVLQGLLYPDTDDLSNPTYTQFETIPSGHANYPLLPMPASDDGTTWPTSSLETEATTPSPFAISSSPLAFLTGDPNYSVSALGPTFWVDMIEYPGTDRRWSVNLDLDGDRGFLASCWTLAPGATITNLPVVPVTLSYTGI
jgi:hypothetical protein